MGPNTSLGTIGEKLAALFPPRSAIREYQDALVLKLSRVFRHSPVLAEWAAMTDERGLYSPRLDAAVGPFATDRNCIEDYNRLVRRHLPLLRSLFDMHRENLRSHGEPDNHFGFDDICSRNLNSRCFLAFE